MSAAPRPEWLDRHLEAMGHANRDGVSRRARLGCCPRCGRRLLIGLDDDVAALPARVEADAALDAPGRLVALLAGKWLYRVSPHRGSAGDALQIDRWSPQDSPGGRPRAGSVIVSSHSPIPAYGPPGACWRA